MNEEKEGRQRERVLKKHVPYILAEKAGRERKKYQRPSYMAKVYGEWPGMCAHTYIFRVDRHLWRGNEERMERKAGENEDRRVPRRGGKWRIALLTF